MLRGLEYKNCLLHASYANNAGDQIVSGRWTFDVKPIPKRTRPNRRTVEPESGTETATGPVFPFGARMSATKMFPSAFGAVKSAIVALATWNTISELKAPDAPLPTDGAKIPNANSPVPFPLKVPVAAAKAGTCASIVISARATPVPLNLKFMKSAEPVFT